jgi:uncharacterized protein YjiK
MKKAPMCLFLACLFAGMISTNCSRPKPGGFRDSLLLSTQNLKAYYNLNEPGEKYFLPYYLSEISGLAFKSPDALLAIQDEEGILYEFNPQSRKVVSSAKFGPRRDFEDVQLVGDSIFVLESNGHIRIFHGSDSVHKKKDIRTIHTDLSIKNDAEGLGYDPKSHSLLIACKASGEIKKNKVEGKAVYRFDLASMTLDTQPFFKVTPEDLEKYFEQSKGHDYEAERFRFEPSAIAFNPADELYYLMASVGKLIVVFDDKGVIRATYSIPASLLRQPEGLCFSPAGDMFISSEGDGDKGYILRYSMKRR